MEDRGLLPVRGQPAPRAPRRARAATPRTSSPAGARGASGRSVARRRPLRGGAVVPAGKAPLGRTAPGPVARVAARARASADALPAPGRGPGADDPAGGPSGTCGPHSPRRPPPRTHTHTPATHLAMRGSHMAGGRRRRLGTRAGDTEAPRSGPGARREAASRGSCGTGWGSAAQAESALPRGCGGPRAVTCRRAAGGEGVALAPRSVSRPAPARGRGPRRGGPASGVGSFGPEVRGRGAGPRRELRLRGGQRRPAVMEAIAPHAHGGALPSGLPRRPLRRGRRTHRAPDAPAPSPEVGSGRGSEAPSCATLVASVMSDSCHAGGSRPGARQQGRQGSRGGAVRWLRSSREPGCALAPRRVVLVTEGTRRAFPPSRGPPAQSEGAAVARCRLVAHGSPGPAPGAPRGAEDRSPGEAEGPGTPRSFPAAHVKRRVGTRQS